MRGAPCGSTPSPQWSRSHSTAATTSSTPRPPVARYWCRLPGVVEGTLAFFRDYRTAGGTWKRYVAEPRKELLVLRKLAEKGRARPPRARLAMAPTGLFARDGLPDVLFWKVLVYWRSERDV